MRQIEHTLMKLGVPPHLSGFRYFATAFKVMQRGARKTWMIYQQVAEMEGSTASRVERSMRHAKEAMFDRINVGLMADIFGETIDPRSGMVTTGQFLATLRVICDEEGRLRDVR